MDPDNPVVRLCAAGMEAEFRQRPDEALVLFLQAWDVRQNDYDACIAAHYIARHQETPEETLRWNQIALDHADAVKDDSVEGFYPSLYLNLGKCHEDLGDLAEAGRYYDLAAGSVECIPDGPYKDMIRKGIEAGKERVKGQGSGVKETSDDP